MWHVNGFARCIYVLYTWRNCSHREMIVLCGRFGWKYGVGLLVEIEEFSLVLVFFFFKPVMDQ